MWRSMASFSTLIRCLTALHWVIVRGCSGRWAAGQGRLPLGGLLLSRLSRTCEAKPSTPWDRQLGRGGNFLTRHDNLGRRLQSGLRW